MYQAKTQLEKTKTVILVEGVAIALILIFVTITIAIAIFDTKSVDGVYKDNKTKFNEFLDGNNEPFHTYVTSLINGNENDVDDRITTLDSLIAHFDAILNNVTTITEQANELIANITLVENQAIALLNSDITLEGDYTIPINVSGNQIFVTKENHGHTFLLYGGAQNNIIVIPTILGLRVKFVAVEVINQGFNNITVINPISQTMVGYIRGRFGDITKAPAGQIRVSMPCSATSIGDTIEIEVITANRVNVHGEIDLTGSGAQWGTIC
jgi:hypothetical protein